MIGHRGGYYPKSLARGFACAKIALDSIFLFGLAPGRSADDASRR
jgi:hypothetical protein